MPRVLFLLSLLFLSACSGGDGGTAYTEPFDPASSLGPFAPRQMRIYPLTHVEVRPDKSTPSDPRSRIICHVEFTDRWYDTVKAIGTVQVHLYRSGGAGFDVQQAKWEINIADLAVNAEWFDPVTRTYRFQLNLPEWAQENLGESFRLVVTFSPLDAGANPPELRDEITLRSHAPGAPMPESVGFPDDAAELHRRAAEHENAQPLNPLPADTSKNATPPR